MEMAVRVLVRQRMDGFASVPDPELAKLSAEMGYELEQRGVMTAIRLINLGANRIVPQLFLDGPALERHLMSVMRLVVIWF